jgi:hypothetical protein
METLVRKFSRAFSPSQQIISELLKTNRALKLLLYIGLQRERTQLGAFLTLSFNELSVLHLLDKV